MDVFVASTPFQLISCTEARNHFDSRHYRLLVVRPDNKTTRSQIAYLLDAFGWDRKSVVWFSKLTFYLKLPGVLRRLLKQPIDTLFIGNRGSWLHEIFYVSLKFKALIFLDDGIGSTVLYYRDARAQHFKSRISEGKKRLLGCLGLSMKSGFQDGTLTFFSCFPLADCGNIRVIQHDFPVFRHRFGLVKGQGRNNGGPLVGYLGQRHGKSELRLQLSRHLQTLARRHPHPARIVYLMHRKQTLEPIGDILKAAGAEAHRNELPIEIEVALTTTGYQAFYGFTSTALFTLKMLFPSLDVYQIEDPSVSAAVHYPDEMADLFRRIGVTKIIF